MKFNLKFIVSILLIVLLVISFVVIILESLSFNNRLPFELQDNLSAAKAIKDVKVNDTIKIVKLGTWPDTLVQDTQYYRYSSLLVHVLALMSGVYLLYTG